MPLSTAADYVTSALKEIGVFAAGEPPPAEDMSDGIDHLNVLINQWTAERLQLFNNTNTIFPIVSGTQTYTVGPTGTVVVTPRPSSIDHVQFINTSSSPSLELQLSPLNDDAWSKVPQKQLTSPFPTCWYWNPTFPNATLNFWPIPTSTTLQGSIYWDTPISGDVVSTTVISVPPGYPRMIIKNLALDLAPSYGSAVTASLQMLAQQAAEAKDVVRTSNQPLLDLSLDQGVLQGGNGLYVYSITAGP